MKKVPFLVLTLLACTIFAQISLQEAAPVIQKLGILQKIDDSPLSYDEFRAAVAKAFPGKENLVKKGSEPVLRKDFILILVKVLGLEQEAAKFKEICTLANDEDKVPPESVGAFTLAFRSDRQLLDYRYGHLLEPFSPITKAEAARSFYMALYPPKRGGTITTAVVANPKGFNTLFTSSGLTWTICNIIGDGYTGTDDNGFYHPRMIKRLPSLENGLIKINPNGSVSITFELRKGMKWHDGHPVTARDAKFQWEVMISDAPITSNYFEKLVQRVDVIDDYTFTIHLPHPVPGMELGSSVYAYYYGWFQLPEHIFREDFEKAKATGKWDEFVQKVMFNPIMTGPYKFKEYVEGQYIVLEAFDGYYMGRPNIDRIVMKIIPDQDVIFASTLKGEIDFGRYTLNLQQSLQLQKEKGDIFNVYFTPNVALWTLDLNFRDPNDLSKPHPLFSDVRVRQAMLYAIDRQQLNEVVFQGLGRIVDTWITELHIMRDALKSNKIKKYPYDPKKAEQLLTEAGWKKNRQGLLEKDGKIFEFTMIAGAGNPQTELMAQLIQAMLKKVGISMKIELKPPLVIWEEAPMGKFDAWLTGWGYGVSDEALNYWGSDMIPSEENNWGGTNYTGWSNPRNDELMRLMAKEVDYKKRVQLYEEHFALWTNDLPVLPLISDPTPHFAKKYIKSFNSTYDSGLGWIIYNWYIDTEQR
ncbi:peptide ABC transporter substrate-binding protein [Pseudothermotoga sp.]|nr:peptide ABC transporter substrate-binding protein [Pseudothermotoga sp.]MDW8140128.1 peptide ABC transporter substrate-binding protein [Pseudothermotoga sp.]